MRYVYFTHSLTHVWCVIRAHRQTHGQAHPWVHAYRRGEHWHTPSSTRIGVNGLLLTRVTKKIIDSRGLKTVNVPAGKCDATARCSTSTLRDLRVEASVRTTRAVNRTSFDATPRPRSITFCLMSARTQRTGSKQKRRLFASQESRCLKDSPSESLYN